jgi:hypothetical protein
MQHPGEGTEVERDQDAEEEKEKNFGNPAREPDEQRCEDDSSERGPEFETRARDRGVVYDQGLLP